MTSTKHLLKEAGLALTLFTFGFSQSASAESYPLDSDLVTIQAKEHRFEEYRGKQSLYLDGGSVIVQDLEFENGTIEFDIALPYTRGFSGVNFRRDDKELFNSEQFYIRHHQGGKPDANQYTPVFNGLTGWQLYHGKPFSTDRSFEEGTWQHIKIVVKGDRADIFIDDMEKVELAVQLKGSGEAGKVSLFASFAPARFANLSVVQSDAPSLSGSPEPYPETPSTRITSWRVSSPFDIKHIQDQSSLDGVDLGDVSWSQLEAEEDGITNLARVATIGEGANTVFAQIVLTSDGDRMVPISFGYSDVVHVFLNDDLLYSGTNQYRTRDYRYLGTIGLFDNLPLHLKKGENVLNFAVSESFGGWGIMADLPATEGVSIKALDQ